MINYCVVLIVVIAQCACDTHSDNLFTNLIKFI